MKKQFLPYYTSRALLSVAFAILIAGFTWKMIALAIVSFGFFLLYLHSGWFKIDTKNAIFPLRRDSRAQLIQRKALIIAIFVGLITYFLLPFISGLWGLTAFSGSTAFALAIIAYFISQFTFLSKT